MKKFSVLVCLAVAFVVIGWTTFANAKEFRIIPDICGEGQHIAVIGDDGHVESLILPYGKVIPAGDLFRKEFVPSVPKKVISKNIKKVEIPSLPKAEVEVKQVMQSVPEKPSVVSTKAKKRVFVANGKTRNEFFGEGSELKAIDAWGAKEEVKVQVPASTSTKLTDTNKTISAPKNTGAINTEEKGKAEKKEVAAGPNQHGQTEVTKAAPQSAVAEVEVPKQDGREVKKAYYQWPQKNPGGNGWQEVGSVLNRINPHTALPENIEKPIQQTLIWAESASGQVFIRPVFGPMGSCPKGLEEIKPTKIEKREDFS